MSEESIQRAFFAWLDSIADERTRAVQREDAKRNGIQGWWEHGYRWATQEWRQQVEMIERQRDSANRRIAELEQVNKVMDGQFQAASRQADFMGACFSQATEEKTELREQLEQVQTALKNTNAGWEKMLALRDQCSRCDERSFCIEGCRIWDEYMLPYQALIHALQHLHVTHIGVQIITEKAELLDRLAEDDNGGTT